MWGSDGALYGTTFQGGGQVSGSVFRIKPAVLQGRQAADQFTVGFEGFASRLYGLYVAETLPPMWTRIATVTNTTGTAAWSQAISGAQIRFYRAQVLNS